MRSPGTTGTKQHVYMYNIHTSHEQANSGDGGGGDVTGDVIRVAYTIYRMVVLCITLMRYLDLGELLCNRALLPLPPTTMTMTMTTTMTMMTTTLCPRCCSRFAMLLCFLASESCGRNRSSMGHDAGSRGANLCEELRVCVCSLGVLSSSVFSR